MRQHFIAAAIGLLAGAVPGTYAVMHKPAPVIVHPQTTIIARTPGVEVSQLDRADRRRMAASWGGLDQKEVDALTEALRSIEKRPITIFCWRDDLCGDMQLDFDNAFESARWDTRLETPLIDDTVGVATSSPALRDAINEATSGRLNVALIDKRAAYEVLVIGKKGPKR